MNIKDLSREIYRNDGEGFSTRMQLAVDELKGGDVVLEVGVGWGELVKSVQNFKNIKLYAVDIAEGALKSVENYVVDAELVDISLEETKFKDNFFDVVICLEVFEHLQNPYHALTEIQRILKPGGKLLISIPNYLGGHIVIYPGLIAPKFFALFLRQNYFQILYTKFWGPVWNKDNVGALLESKINSKFIVTVFLRFCQAAVRILQIVSSAARMKTPPLYWCYFYICKNKKDEMDAPFWKRQLEQTSELGQYKGWYHKYYHRKA